MSFTKTEMLYYHEIYYKWTAAEDHDDPHYTKGKDHEELNRTEGWEVLYFLNHFWKKHFPGVTPTLSMYQQTEKMIRHNVPHNIRKHKEIADWMIANWARYYLE